MRLGRPGRPETPPQPHVDVKGLWRRRQFILGPRSAAVPEAWAQRRLRDGSVLRVHPDLPFVEAGNERLGLTLLGFALDPFHPERTDEDILEVLLGRIQVPAEAAVAAQDLGGRWVLIAHQPQDAIVVGDPCGLREVYYTTAEVGERWCASQSGHIASELHLPLDEEAQRSFVRSPYFVQNPGAWWPGDASPYAAIRHLTPNHYLTLGTGGQTRFWPRSERPRLSVAESALVASSRLENIVGAGARRFKLALPLTAGMDSRTILAALKGIPDVFFFTMLYGSLTTRSPDIRVPTRLLERYGLAHEVIGCTSELDESIADLHRGNADAAPDEAAPVLTALFRRYPQERVWLSGHCGEVARCSNPARRGLYTDRVVAPELSRFAEMHDNDFAIAQFDRWLRGAQVARSLGFFVADIFEWEQWYGRWGAAGQTEFDLVCERLTPFNCRAVLEPLLGVDLASRSPETGYAVFRELIRLLWPELLDEPFNPPYTSLKLRARGAVVSALERTGTRPAVRRARRRLRGTDRGA